MVQSHHGDFDDVGAGALDWGIGGGPQLLALHPGPSGHLQLNGERIPTPPASQAGWVEVEGAAAPQDRFHIALAQGQAFLHFQIGEDAGVTLPVTAQEVLGLGLAHACFSGETLGTHAIDHTEVDRLAEPPFVGADLVFVKQEAGGEGMDIIPLVEGLDQHLFPREVGEDAQLDLGIVGADQLPAFLGQEGLADPTTELGADRNVLEVGIAA